MISSQGRVIDVSDERQITTSEGQSYAMFLALVANNRELFRRLLAWTRDNLAGGDLTARLPAWLWGRRANGSWGVLDDNSASDSDLWIAYSLIEAGRLWRLHEYTSLGTLLLQRIAREETLDIPGLGMQLLPGRQGFVHDNRWTLNPSYVPPQILARARAVQPTSVWPSLERDSLTMIESTSPLGLAPDWAAWNGQAFGHDEPRTRTGSYDAIRVYLWAGMLANDAPGAARLKAHLGTIAQHVTAQGRAPERVDIINGTVEGGGPAGFSAALLPLLRDTPAGAALQDYLDTQDLSRLGYYNRMLALFSEGWMAGRYRFDAAGKLQTTWEDCPG